LFLSHATKHDPLVRLFFIPSAEASVAASVAASVSARIV
jgi:hypothetical protein